MSILRPLLRDAASALLFGAGLTRPARVAAGRLCIATFHRVLPPSALAEYAVPAIAVTPEELAWFLGFFAAHFTCGTLAETAARHAAGDRPGKPLLALTFDDGQRDNFQHARPVLAAAGARASFFAVSQASTNDELLWHDRASYALSRTFSVDAPRAAAYVSALGVAANGARPPQDIVDAAIARLKTLPADEVASWVERAERDAGGPVRPPWDGMMSPNELRALARDGHEVGSHSHAHAILPACSDERLRREVAQSKDEIAAMTGVDVQSFCYPNGDHDDRVVAAVRAAGYARAVTTSWGANDAGADPFRLRRWDVQGRTARSALGGLSPARMALRMSGLNPGLG